MRFTLALFLLAYVANCDAAAPRISQASAPADKVRLGSPKIHGGDSPDEREHGSDRSIVTGLTGEVPTESPFPSPSPSVDMTPPTDSPRPSPSPSWTPSIFKSKVPSLSQVPSATPSDSPAPSPSPSASPSLSPSKSHAPTPSPSVSTAPTTSPSSAPIVPTTSAQVAPPTDSPIVPTTTAPVTASPVAPTTTAPVTPAPVTPAPVTPAPVATDAPVVTPAAPVTISPVSTDGNVGGSEGEGDGDGTFDTRPPVPVPVTPSVAPSGSTMPSLEPSRTINPTPTPSASPTASTSAIPSAASSFTTLSPSTASLFAPTAAPVVATASPSGSSFPSFEPSLVPHSTMAPTSDKSVGGNEGDDDETFDTRVPVTPETSVPVEPTTGSPHDISSHKPSGSLVPPSLPSIIPSVLTTESPVTSSPVTNAPVSSAPVTAAPVTAAPVTAAPVAPTTSTPTIPAPVTAAPVAPVTGAPTPAPTSSRLNVAAGTIISIPSRNLMQVPERRLFQTVALDFINSNIPFGSSRIVEATVATVTQQTLVTDTRRKLLRNLQDNANLEIELEVEGTIDRNSADTVNFGTIVSNVFTTNEQAFHDKLAASSTFFASEFEQAAEQANQIDGAKAAEFAADEVDKNQVWPIVVGAIGGTVALAALAMLFMKRRYGEEQFDPELPVDLLSWSTTSPSSVDGKKVMFEDIQSPPDSEVYSEEERYQQRILSPIAEDMQAKLEECDVNTPRNEYTTSNATPRGTKFVQLDFNAAKRKKSTKKIHTGILNDLDDMEGEWEGQLDSKVTAVAGTPRQNNLEKFKRGTYLEDGSTDAYYSSSPRNTPSKVIPSRDHFEPPAGIMCGPSAWEGQ